MTITFRRLAALATAVFMTAGSIAPEAYAQGATVGPAGGIPSTTAPANGEGTPAGGTGTVGTARVGPSGIAPTANPSTAPTGDEAAPRPRRRRHRHRRAHRAPAQVGTQSQDGTNQ